GAQTALVGEARIDPAGLLVPVHLAEHGHPTPQGRAAVRAWLRNPATLDNPTARNFHPLPDRFLTRTRQHGVNDQAFYATTFFNEVLRPCRLDHGLLSRHTTSDRGDVHEVILNRLLGAPPFDRRECQLVHLLQEEVVPLLGLRLATTESVGPA